MLKSKTPKFTLATWKDIPVTELDEGVRLLVEACRDERWKRWRYGRTQCLFNEEVKTFIFQLPLYNHRYLLHSITSNSTDRHHMEFIGVETYYDNGDTGVTWFYNDMNITQEELLTLMIRVTDSEKYEITSNNKGDFVVLKNQARSKNQHHDTFGCFLWGKETDRYPWNMEDMNKKELDDHFLSTSFLVRQLIRFL